MSTSNRESDDEIERALEAWDRFSNESIETLEKPPGNGSVFDRASHAEKLAEQQLRKLSQDNDHRATFFRFATRLAFGCIAANFGVFVAYMVSEWREISDTVMVSWISATIVEVIAIVVIIAKYLFANGHDDRDENSAEQDPPAQ